MTQDESPWWLRADAYSEGPSEDYQSGCLPTLFAPSDGEDKLTFKFSKCDFHAKSYYCQLEEMSTKPKDGSPLGCACEKVQLSGRYSGGGLVRCTGCLEVKKSTQKNSCPVGTKIFAPASREDWKTIIKSVTPITPTWIIDITRPQSGCGGCSDHAMNSDTSPQATWVTSDNAPWWLRDAEYEQPNADYEANCYMNVLKSESEGDIKF